MSDPTDETTHPNAAIIRRAFALQNAHEADALADLHAPDSVFQDIPLGAFPTNHAEMKTLWTDTWAALSDFRMEPDVIVADDHGGAASFTMSGRHTGDFPGYPASGNSFSLRGATIVRIDDGRITGWTDYWSTGDMDAQLGAKQERTA